jgi:hypothetical protein
MLGVNEILGDPESDIACDEDGGAEEDRHVVALIEDIEDFWDERRRSTYPTFAAALQHVLALPAGNIPAESLFSHCDLVNTKRRSRLDDALLSTYATLHYEGFSMVKSLVAEAEAGGGASGVTAAFRRA